MTPLVDGGARAPGCAIRGCPNPVAPGVLICELHSRILADTAGHEVPPAGSDGRVDPPARAA